MEVKLVILSYSRLTAEMQGVWNEFKAGMNIEVEEGIFGKALSVAKRFEKEGKVDVFISGGANATILRQNVTVPVVCFKVTGFDLLRATLKARKYSCKVAVINYERNIPELHDIQDLLNVSIYQDVYHNEAELVNKIITLRQTKPDVKAVIGGSLTCDMAEKYGLKGILVYSSEAVRQAIENAHEIALSNRCDVEKASRLKAILDYTYSGIIATDKNGIITVFNPAAERILGIAAEKAIGRPVDEMIPNTQLPDVLRNGKAEINQLQKIGSTHISTNRIPIMTQNEIYGAVATFQDVPTIQKAERKIRLNLHGRGLVAKFNFTDIIGQDPVLLRKLERAKSFALTESTIMIFGETGTGKELLAQSIHNYSPRKDKPFVAVNCAALSETLMESELFGYIAGAFTGAQRGGKMGLFELAHGGTIFLDEVSEFPLLLQSKLLRVLQEREIMRVGSDRIIPVDVRVIVASNKDLLQYVKEKKIRDDLYYRLNVLEIKIPPLRERKSDIPLLVNHFIDRMEPALKHRVEQFLPVLMSDLESYAWPGNIRELQNVMERLVVLAQDTRFDLGQLRELMVEVMNNYVSKATVSKDSNGNHEISPGEITVEIINKVLQEVKGNKSEAARRLGISRMTLWRKLKEPDSLVCLPM